MTNAADPTEEPSARNLAVWQAGARAVLFADIAGSTKLYESLGDTEAKRQIDESLSALTALTGRHGGRVIKTIGDEIMCLFEGAERGFHAAIEMQHKINTLPIAGGAKRRIRIGFHAGTVIEENGDVFGDTVNVAARMTALAQGMQIMTSRSTVDALPQYLRGRTRDITSVSVKGKADDMPVCEVLWQDEGDLTMTLAVLSASPLQAELAQLASLRQQIVLRHGGAEITLDVNRVSAAMGRDPGSDIVVADPKASRNHARIEKRRDKFFLADTSTNGTFITFTGEREIALRREEIMLRGSGQIRFGHSAIEGSGETVDFTVRG